MSSVLRKTIVRKDYSKCVSRILSQVYNLDSHPLAPPQRLQREVNVWKLLDHESVANYHGVVYHSNKPAIVSSWYVNGCADVYLRDHPEVNPLKTVGVLLRV